MKAHSRYSARAGSGLALMIPILSFTLAVSPRGTAAAQDKGPVLHGVVRDSAGAPLEAAEVELFGIHRKAVTGVNGAFRFEGLRNSRFWVLARLVGYLPRQISVSLENDEQRSLPITLYAAPARLSEVVVEARSDLYVKRMRDFIWRSRTAWGGRFLTRDDIAKANPATLGDLVIRHMPFKHRWVMGEVGGWAYLPHPLAAGPYSFARFSRRGRYLPDCAPAVSVNGAGISFVAVNDFDPADIEALEVYREGSDLPIEFSFAGRTRCGLVVVWLKSYAQIGVDGERDK